MLDPNLQTHSDIDQLALIEFRDVCLSIEGAGLINQINCKLNHGGITVLMGPNGAGKTLFLRLLAGLLVPSRGEVICRGGVFKNVENPQIAMLFQQPVMLRRSASKNIEFVLHHHNIRKQFIADKTSKAIAQARLVGRENVSARQLSSGERQRLALARALVVRPEILLLDEVTSSLDPASVGIVEEMIGEASREGTKIILITHDVRQAKRMADEILFIHQGEVLAQKPAVEFLNKPGSAQAQAYLDGRVPDELYRRKYNG